MKVDSELFLCYCNSVDHQIIFQLWDYASNEKEMLLFPPEENLMVEIEVHLPDTTFWRRLWYAVRYVFGRKSNYGAWDVAELNYEATGRFIEALQRYRNRFNLYKQKYEEAKKNDAK